VAPGVSGAESADHQPAVAWPDLAGVVVLVLDDEADAREMIQEALRRCGATVHLSGSAADGLAMLQQERPHIVLSDIGMPGDDGRTFIRRVRALSAGEGGHTPAVAVSAYVGEEEQRASVAAGYQAHLCKPIDLSLLVQTVADLTHPLPGAVDVI
jgi:CheY-like chemotaxis protein